MKEKDFKFNWQDWKQTNCECRVRVYGGINELAGKTIVIVTDLNVGNSVTNEAETLATMLAQKERIKPADLVFIEHYEARPFFDETFDRVRFKWNDVDLRFEDPEWEHVEADEIWMLTGDADFARKKLKLQQSIVFASDNESVLRHVKQRYCLAKIRKISAWKKSGNS